MSPELTEREMQAVNSEHTKNISNDGWRENRLLKHLSHPLSEFNRFSTGNLDTLNKPFIRD
jgi:insulysin